MAEPLEWRFAMLDKLSDPADKMAEAVAKLETKLTGTDETVSKLGNHFDETGKAARALANFFGGGAPSAFDKFKKKTDEAKGSWLDFGKVSSGGAGLDLNKLTSGGGFAGAFTLGIQEGVHLLVDGVKAAIGLLVDAGKKAYEIGASFVKASAASEKTTFQFSHLAGGKDALAHFEGISKNTAFDDDELKKTFRPLVTAGFKDQGLKDAVAAALDVEATGGDVGTVVSVLQKIHTTGKISAKELRSGFEGIFDEKGYLAELAKLYGTTAQAAKKRMEEGKIGADTLLSVIYAKLAERGGGKLGQTAVDAGNTVEARLHKLQELPGQFTKALAGSSGLGSFNDFLGRLLVAFDPDGPRGQKIIGGITRIFDKLLGMLDGVGDDKAFDKIEHGIMLVIGAASLLVDGLAALGRWFDDVAGADDRAAASFSSFGATAAGVVEKVTGIVDEMFGVGRSSVDGFVEGIKSGYDAVTEAMEGMGETAKTALKEYLHIKSPSKVFEEYGAMSAEGFNRGLGSADPDVSAFAPTGGGAGGGGGTVIDVGGITVVLPQGAGADPARDGELQDLVVRGVLEAFEELATSQGA